MIAPCHECTRRTVSPNCHSTCEEYLLYKAEKDRIREQRRLRNICDHTRIEHAIIRKNSFFKQRRK